MQKEILKRILKKILKFNLILSFFIIIKAVFFNVYGIFGFFFFISNRIYEIIYNIIFMSIILLPFEIYYVIKEYKKDIKECKKDIKVKYIDRDIVNRRICIYLIDTVVYNIILSVMFVICIIIKEILGFEDLLTLNMIEWLENWGLVIFIFCLIVLEVVYYYICYLKFSTTIGGIICNLKIIDKNNKELSKEKILKRSIFKVITKYIMLSLPFLFTCFEKREVWYDELLGIDVVLDKTEDENMKKKMLKLEFNFIATIIGFVIISPILGIILIFANAGLVTVEGIIVVEIYGYFYTLFILLIVLMIILFLVNIILYPFRKIYIRKRLKNVVKLN